MAGMPAFWKLKERKMAADYPVGDGPSIKRATNAGLDGKGRLHFSPVDREKHDDIFTPPDMQSCGNCGNAFGPKCETCNPNEKRVIGPRNWISKEGVNFTRGLSVNEKTLYL